MSGNLSKQNNDEEKYRGITAVQQPQAAFMNQHAQMNFKGLGSELKPGLQQASLQMKAQPVKLIVKTDSHPDLKAWDGLSPYNTFSSEEDPSKVAEQLNAMFDSIIEQDLLKLDVERKDFFTFKGKLYEANGSCEFQVKVFGASDVSQHKDTVKGEVEIRRLSGYAFGFVRLQDFLLERMVDKQLVSYRNCEQGEDDIKSELTVQSGFQVKSFSLAGIELGDGEFFDETSQVSESMSGVSGAESSADETFEMKEVPLEELLKRATSKEAFLNDLRFDVQQLHERATENDKAFPENFETGAKMIAEFAGNCLDTWIVQMQLETLQLLINKGHFCGKKNLFDQVKAIKNRWSSKVVNKIIQKSNFDFPPSQAICKVCSKIMDKLEAQYES